MFFLRNIFLQVHFLNIFMQMANLTNLLDKELTQLKP